MATKALGFILLLVTFVVYSEELKFKVFMNAQEVGFHHYEIDEIDSVNVAQYNIPFMFMKFNYQHESKEKYKDQCLVAIESKTNDDGDLYMLSGKTTEDKLEIKANNKNLGFKECVSTFRYWDKKILDNKKLLNAQNGELLDIETQLINTENILIKDKVVNADHFKLRASLDGKEKFTIHLWYDRNNKWSKLMSPTAIGELTYIKE